MSSKPHLIAICTTHHQGRAGLDGLPQCDPASSLPRRLRVVTCASSHALSPCAGRAGRGARAETARAAGARGRAKYLDVDASGLAATQSRGGRILALARPL
eukprot:6172329-Pleurochrysis_carterae.AAC.1